MKCCVFLNNDSSLLSTFFLSDTKAQHHAEITTLETMMKTSEDALRQMSLQHKQTVRKVMKQQVFAVDWWGRGDQSTNSIRKNDLICFVLELLDLSSQKDKLAASDMLIMELYTENSRLLQTLHLQNLSHSTASGLSMWFFFFERLQIPISSHHFSSSVYLRNPDCDRNSQKTLWKFWMMNFVSNRTFYLAIYNLQNPIPHHNLTKEHRNCSLSPL